MPNSPEVSFAFGAEGDQSLLAVIKQLRTEMGTLKQQQDQLGDSATGADRAFRNMSQGAALTTREMREAKGEAALLGEGIGIRLPRHVRNFLVELPGVANLLTAAFSATAVFFLIDAISQLPDKIREITASLMGWSKEARQAYDDQIKLNDAYLGASEKLEQQKHHLREGGLQGAARTRAEIQGDREDVTQIEGEINQARKKIDSLNKSLNPAPHTGVDYLLAPAAKDEIPEEDKKRWIAEIKAQQERVQQLIEKRDELKGIRLPQLQGALGRESSQEAGALGKQKFEAEESSAVKGAERELRHQKDVLQTEQEQDAAAHEAGLLSLKEYYARRFDALVTGLRNEQTAIAAERAAAEKHLEELKNLPVGPTAQDKVARLNEEESIKQRIADLDARKDHAEQAAEREKNKLIVEQGKAELDLLHKRLEMQKQSAELQGNRALSDEIEGEIDRLRATEAVLQGVMTEAQASAWLRDQDFARTTKSKGEGARQHFDQGFKKIEDTRADLQEQVAAGQLEPYQAARKLRAVYLQQLGDLREQVQILRDLAAAAEAAAVKRGEKPHTNAEAIRLNTEADDLDLKRSKLGAEVLSMDSSWENWKTTARQSIDQVSGEFTSGINGMIANHQRFGQAAAQTWNSMVMTGIQAAEKIAAHWIASHLKMLLVKQATNKAAAASDAAANAQKESSDKKTGSKSILISAKEAAAKAWSAFAHIPVIGPVLGAAAAAATFAGVMALAAFQTGGVVDADRHAPTFNGKSFRGMVSGPGGIDKVPAWLTDGESVLTTRATRALGKDAINAFNGGDFSSLRSAVFLPPLRPAYGGSSSFAKALASGASPARSSSGDVHFNHTTNIDGLQALDGASVRAALEEHGDLIGDIAVAAVRDYMRQGGVNR